MAVFSIIKLSELEGAKRIDAEYYKPEYLALKLKIEKYSSHNLKEIAYITDGSHEIRSYQEKGVLFLRSQDIFEIGLIVQEPAYISKEEDLTLKRSKPELNDILVTKTGNVGASLVVDEVFPNCNLPADIALIRIKNRSFNPYFLATFLNSRIGRGLIFRELTGCGRPRVVLDNLKELRIPKLPTDIQNSIELLIKEVYKQKRLSESLYSQAEDLLLEELGLKDFKPKYKKTYTANLSSAFSAHRIDAEYFQPAYEEVSKKIKEYPNGFSRLLKHVENVNPNFDPTKYPEQTFSYVELADIDFSIGVIHSVNELKGKEAPSRARRMLKEGDVIVSSVEGSLEKVALVDKEYDGCLASTGFFQFRPLDILPETLLVLSKTIVLQSQLKKKCSGTILTAVPKESLRDIIIPMFPLSTQQKIASLVQRSHETRRKAKELLEVAKKAVEIAIENNEKEALDYISKAEEK